MDPVATAERLDEDGCISVPINCGDNFDVPLSLYINNEIKSARRVKRENEKQG